MVALFDPRVSTKTWALIEPEPNSGCWLWLGGTTSNGYAQCKKTVAHKVIYELSVGPVLAWLELDHLCRVRLCVNPNHLEPVTRIENLGRSPFFHTERPRCGHSYDMIEQGRRRCKHCRSMRPSQRWTLKRTERKRLRRAEARKAAKAWDAPLEVAW